ncbi:MAG: zeta toxin family protein, partial [Cupriavidus necator]
MVIAGQPGAGLTYASVMLRQQLMHTVAAAAHVSLNRLRAYHPLWAAGGDVAPTAAARVTAHCQAWFDRFVSDVQTRRLNLVVEVET